jgi:DNA repair protein RadA/Sms
VRISEPASDLSLAVAIAGGTWSRRAVPGLVAIGEVGLAGEVRRVTGVQRRLGEAERMGFRLAIVPAGSAAAGASGGIEVREVEDIRAAMAAAFGG